MSIPNNPYRNKPIFSDIRFGPIAIIFSCLAGLFIFLAFPQGLKPKLGLRWEARGLFSGYSSPQLVDVNSDGIQDIILGSGLKWSSDGGSVVAINGKNGETIWKTSTPEAIRNQPLLVDVNSDGVLDVGITGDFDDVWMMDGVSGSILWRLSKKNPQRGWQGGGFHSPTLVPDINHDGVQDMLFFHHGLAMQSSELRVYDHKTGQLVLNMFNKDAIEAMIVNMLNNHDDDWVWFRVCYQGDCFVRKLERRTLMFYSFELVLSLLGIPYSNKNAALFIISAVDGEVLATFPIPNHIPNKGSPAYFFYNGDLRIIYGTGNEHEKGAIVSQSILTGDVHWAFAIDPKGVAGSLKLIEDINGPVVYTHTLNGEAMKLDAITGKAIWKTEVGASYLGFSSVQTMAVRPNTYADMVSVFSLGKWPHYSSAVLFVFDGQTGKITHRQHVGYCRGGAHPVIADLNGDEKKDIVFVSCADKNARLVVLDHKKKEWFNQKLNSGSYSAPIVGDLDNDGHTDVVVPLIHGLSRFQTIKKVQ